MTKRYVVIEDDNPGCGWEVALGVFLLVLYALGKAIEWIENNLWILALLAVIVVVVAVVWWFRGKSDSK